MKNNFTCHKYIELEPIDMCCCKIVFLSITKIRFILILNAPVVVPNINDSQSTHNANVHQAVSESATRLAHRYQLMIGGGGIESAISMVQSYVVSLSDDSQKNKVAKRCVLKITAPDYTFTDHGSQITTRQ